MLSDIIKQAYTKTIEITEVVPTLTDNILARRVPKHRMIEAGGSFMGQRRFAEVCELGVPAHAQEGQFYSQTMFCL